MSNFFKEMASELKETILDSHAEFGERFLATVLALLFIALGLNIISKVAYAVYLATNEVAIEKIITVKAVASKEFYPATSSMSLIAAGPLIPITFKTSEKYSLCFEINQSVVCKGVRKDIYEDTDVGQPFGVVYGIGRLDGKPVLKQLWKK